MLIPLIDVGPAVRSAPRKAGEFGYSPPAAPPRPVPQPSVLVSAAPASTAALPSYGEHSALPDRWQPACGLGRFAPRIGRCVGVSRRSCRPDAADSSADRAAARNHSAAWSMWPARPPRAASQSAEPTARPRAPRRPTAGRARNAEGQHSSRRPGPDPRWPRLAGQRGTAGEWIPTMHAEVVTDLMPRWRGYAPASGLTSGAYDLKRQAPGSLTAVGISEQDHPLVPHGREEQAALRSTGQRPILDQRLRTSGSCLSGQLKRGVRRLQGERPRYRKLGWLGGCARLGRNQ